MLKKGKSDQSYFVVAKEFYEQGQTLINSILKTYFDEHLIDNKDVSIEIKSSEPKEAELYMNQLEVNPKMRFDGLSDSLLNELTVIPLGK